MKCDDEVAVDAALAAIAKRHLGIPTLDERKSDSLDFHAVSVWGLRDALRAAYRAGREATRGWPPVAPRRPTFATLGRFVVGTPDWWGCLDDSSTVGRIAIGALSR